MARRAAKTRPLNDLRQLHPVIRQKVLELAGGDKTRVEVVSHTQAIVR